MSLALVLACTLPRCAHRAFQGPALGVPHASKGERARLFDSDSSHSHSSSPALQLPLTNRNLATQEEKVSSTGDMLASCRARRCHSARPPGERRHALPRQSRSWQADWLVLQVRRDTTDLQQLRQAENNMRIPIIKPRTVHFGSPPRYAAYVSDALECYLLPVSGGQCSDRTDQLCVSISLGHNRQDTSHPTEYADADQSWMSSTASSQGGYPDQTPMSPGLDMGGLSLTPYVTHCRFLIR